MVSDYYVELGLFGYDDRHLLCEAENCIAPNNPCSKSSLTAAGTSAAATELLRSNMPETSGVFAERRLRLRSSMETNFNAVTGANESLITLSGEVGLSTVGTTAAGFATGVGEAKFALDFLTFAYGMGTCIH